MVVMTQSKDLKDDGPSAPRPVSGHPEPISPISPISPIQALPAQPYVEFHDDPDETDSACGDDSSTTDDTRTLSSYVTDYPFEFGRRYHAFHDGAYWGPNDDAANNQQNLNHYMYLLTLNGKLHLAPLDNPQEILDVGTGTGAWAIDMADAYPNAQVTGVDLSATQPAFVPPNCIFEIDDMTQPWTYPNNRFDMIHVREMFGSIPDWDDFFRSCYRALKPGGYIEVVEHATFPISDDDSIGPDSFYRVWEQTVAQAGARSGKSYTIWKESADRLRAGGFQEVVEQRFKWPMNEWSDDPRLNEIGWCNRMRLSGDLEGYMLRHLTVTLGWSYARAAVFLASARACLRDQNMHAYLPVTVVTARRPFWKGGTLS